MSDQRHRLTRLIPGFIRRDFLRKLIALCFAILVWFKVSNQIIGVDDIIRNVPVTITVPAGVEILDQDTPRLVDVVVRSSQRRLNLLQPGEIKAVIPILAKQYQGGQETLHLELRPEHIHTPLGVTVVRVQQKNWTINLDRRATRRIPVRPVVGGSLMDNYAYGEVSVHPHEVSVSGPESMLRQLAVVHTREILLQRENTDSFETTAEILPLVGGLQATPAQVRVQIEIYRRYETRNFRGLRVSVLFNEGKFAKFLPRLDYDKVDVSVHGVRDAIHGLAESNIRPFVDLTDHDQPGTYQLPIQVWLSTDEIKILEVKPNSVEIIIEPR